MQDVAEDVDMSPVCEMAFVLMNWEDIFFYSMGHAMTHWRSLPPEDQQFNDLQMSNRGCG